MNTLELKQKIISKIESADDIDLLKQIMNILQPVNPNKIKHLNENELEMARENDEDTTFKNAFSEEQFAKEDSEWITEL